MLVLAVNAGSSSLKLSVLDGDQVVAARELPAPRAVVETRELEDALDGLPAAHAVGHRIVHGGARVAPALVDAALVAELEALVDLAPLHQPKSLAALRAVSGALPGVPAVACFDTAFHATLPPAAATIPVPAGWRERFGLRRYGFHGLSHAWAARRASALLGRPARVVTCHLGAGASLAAVHDGVCVDTTMSFTPLDGLVMATRSGSVDPGLVLWLAERLGDDEVADGLEHRSGLTALAGTGDMRELLARDDPDALLALEVYLHALVAHVAAMAAAMDGLDALVFTGGVGERAPAIRARAAARLRFLGVAVDDERNAAAAGEADVSAPGATARTLVVPSREDAVIARHVRDVLGEAALSPGA
ncbi:MAG TPA: acetate/propionate family kinase [Baekduia sp.]|nr:acetate/propionate family kinase [Baekduia sp.]